jgi:hypothetical protein
MGIGRPLSISNPTLFFTDLLSFPVTTVSSTQVFHAPQAGHFPNHFGDSLPHSLQKKVVFSFAIGLSVYAAKIRKTTRKRIESEIFPIFAQNQEVG